VTEHGKRKIVLASDCLAASMAMATTSCRSRPKLLCGTGRLAALYATQCRDTTTVRAGPDGKAGSVDPFTKLAADYSAAVARKSIDKLYHNYADAEAAAADADDADAKLLDGCDEDGFDETVSGLWRQEDEDEIAEARTAAEYTEVDRTVLTRGRYSSGVEFKTEEEIKADPYQPWEDSLDYIRRMQRSTGPVIPFRPFVRLAVEIAQDFKTDLQFELASFQVLQSMVEDYLHTILVDANLAVLNDSNGCGRHKVFPFQPDDEKAAQAMKSSRSLAVAPRDLQLARRIRGDRA